jgi:hypothetical protein
VLLWQAGAPPIATTVGRVTVVAWPAQAALGTLLADAADREPPFPDLGETPQLPIRLIVAPDRARFDSITRGRLPSWSAGAAFPEAGGIVLLAEPRVDRVLGALRHEMAHVELRRRIGRRAPLWFEEGFAAVAAGEWDRLDALRLDWQVARGVHMDLDSLDRALRGDATDAGAAYGLATTAVLLLKRWGGDSGLRPLIARLATAPTFEQALRDTYHITGGDFEDRWQRDLASRYGWLGWAQAVGVFWAVVGVGLVVLVQLRRRRDAERRALLDMPGPDLPGPDIPSP